MSYRQAFNEKATGKLLAVCMRTAAFGYNGAEREILMGMDHCLQGYRRIYDGAGLRGIGPKEYRANGIAWPQQIHNAQKPRHLFFGHDFICRRSRKPAPPFHRPRFSPTAPTASSGQPRASPCPSVTPKAACGWESTPIAASRDPSCYPRACGCATSTSSARPAWASPP